ncbi:RloF, partial [Candidatus Synechococcus spongiarum]
MNFNTANSTLRQLLANGLRYRVPMFQRDYAWGPDEWDDLWQDMVALVDEEDAEPAHYMGYLVLQSPNNREFDIIDGQQRMTTMSVLILAAIAHLMDLSMAEGADSKNRQRADQLRNSYIGYLDPVTLVSQSKLTLNKNNDRFYKHYLIPLEEPLRKQGLNVSENLLRQAFLWFKDHIKKQSSEDGVAVARFIDALVDKLLFTVITVTDELNAFKVFETLNARGVRLSATDLLKNCLFSVVSRDKSHEQDIKGLEDRWDGIVNLLGSERFPEFLRTFWNSRNKLVRKAELFKVI